MHKHVLQSDLWAQFKQNYGTPAIKSGNILYTKHKIPFSSYYVAYCPRVSPEDIEFDKLKDSLKENNCIGIQFDVPNVIAGTSEAKKALEIFQKNECIKSIRDEFAKGNFLIDLTKSDEELMSDMHKKRRYNIKYAMRKGVNVRKVEDEKKDFEIFYNLYNRTGDRQKFFNRSHDYMKNIWEVFRPAGAAEILIAEYKDEPLTAWLVFKYENILYYPYGGSSDKLKNLQHSCLVGWEAMKYGKKQGCTTFDLWGAAEDPNDKTDPYYGFTRFKEKYGGRHITYIDSHDLVINQPLYKLFITANQIRWKLLNAMKN